MTTLQDLVSGERAKQQLSLREVAERSHGQVSSSTVHAIEQGKRTSVEEETLQGLARALNLPPARLARAAGLVTSDTVTPFVLPKRADRLTRREREHVLALVELLLDRRTR